MCRWQTETREGVTDSPYTIHSVLLRAGLHKELSSAHAHCCSTLASVRRWTLDKPATVITNIATIWHRIPQQRLSLCTVWRHPTGELCCRKLSFVAQGYNWAYFRKRRNRSGTSEYCSLTHLSHQGWPTINFLHKIARISTIHYPVQSWHQCWC